MKILRILLALTLIVAVVGLAWFVLDDYDSAVPSNGISQGCESPAKPEKIEVPKPKQPKPDLADRVADKPRVPDSIAPNTPNLHTPDYGPLLQRGNGQVSFELFDANNERVVFTNERISLLRLFGGVAISDRCHFDNNRIVCGGLGNTGNSTGLEPGDYELTMLSNRWGNMRQRFHVERGEQRIERLQSKFFKRTVCFYFVDQDGQPIEWVAALPYVVAKSEALPSVSYATPEDSFLESRPDLRPDGGGMSWGRGGQWRPYHYPPMRYPTDEGRFYASVWAGTTNTVIFPLDEKIWGTKEFKITDTFLDARWDMHQVTLNLPNDFKEKVDALNHYGLKSPGNKPTEEEPVIVEKDTFLPESSPFWKGCGRVIVTMTGSSELKPIIAFGTGILRRTRPLRYANQQWYYDCKAGSPYQVAVEGLGYTSDWYDVKVTNGQITHVHIDVEPTTVQVDTSSLTPTLNAAAFLLEFQLNSQAAKRGPAEEPKAIDGANQLEASNWDKPAAGTSFLQRYLLKKDSGKYSRSLLINENNPFSAATGRIGYRTVLRTAARHRNTDSASHGPNGRYYFEPTTLKSPWTYLKGDGQALLKQLQDGEIKPTIDGVFACRAVGENQEGLPWVQGILMPLESEELALAVKVRMESTPDGNVPSLDNKVMNEYAAELAAIDEVEESESTSALKKLIGEDNYKLFENDEQRLWFANNASWYNSHMKVFSDDHGYILTRKHKLEDGKNYVLYLWSSSRDQMKPDKRIVFKAGKNNTDLGVIRLPSYR